MNASELREMNAQQLNDELLRVRKEQFHLRVFPAVSGSPETVREMFCIRFTALVYFCVFSDRT